MRREALQDEIALRRASLEDAARELASGELGTDAYDELVVRETKALSRLEAALEALGPEHDVATESSVVQRSPRRRSPRRLVIALVCFALATVGLVWINVSLRQAGTSQTGSVQVSGAQAITQLLLEGEGDLAQGNDVAALAAYQSVLAKQPNNVAALTEAGWLDFSAGSAAHDASVVRLAVASLRRAVEVAPNQAAPHLYYGIVAAATPHNGATAKKQFEEFLADHPSIGQLAVAKSYLGHFGLRY
jgi:tetratricopeptide (TPR) repeat protein